MAAGNTSARFSYIQAGLSGSYSVLGESNLFSVMVRCRAVSFYVLQIDCAHAGGLLLLFADWTIWQCSSRSGLSHVVLLCRSICLSVCHHTHADAQDFLTLPPFFSCPETLREVRHCLVCARLAVKCSEVVCVLWTGV